MGEQADEKILALTHALNELGRMVEAAIDAVEEGAPDAIVRLDRLRAERKALLERIDARPPTERPAPHGEPAAALNSGAALPADSAAVPAEVRCRSRSDRT
jgi:hypothetical protein